MQAVLCAARQRKAEQVVVVHPVGQLRQALVESVPIVKVKIIAAGKSGQGLCRVPPHPLDGHHQQPKRTRAAGKVLRLFPNFIHAGE